MWISAKLAFSNSLLLRSWVLVLAAFVLPCSVFSQGPADIQLAGVWGTEVRFGSPVEGRLMLDGRGPTWRAMIAGYQVGVRTRAGSVEFELPGHAGAFRGHLDRKRNLIEGHWIQPGGLILDPEYASPMELRAIATGIWQGQIVPLEQRMSVYLNIVSASEGLTATATNPEANFFRRRLYRVSVKGSIVSLEANGKRFDGAYDAQSGVLSIQLASWLPPFQFTRRSGDNAVGFYPRTPPNVGDWHYQAPLSLGDGWRTSTLRAEGLDETAIGHLVEKILKRNPADTSLDIQSLLIARHGRLVLEEYFDGFSEDRVHDMRSAGKTFAPVLAGIAKDEGAKLAPDTLIYPLFSQYSSFANWDSGKQKIRLRDLMTMTAGNACDDNEDDSPGNEDRMQSSPQKDWYKYTLDLPILKEPGGKNAVYCSGDLNLVGGAAAAATNTWLPDLFEKKLARPLQFGRYYLNLMPDGQAYMGGGAYVRPRDQIKVGQVYLDGGVWNGRRVISKQWVENSTSAHSRFADARSLGQKHEYGYGWHIHELRGGGHVYRAFAAEGNGGQFIVVIPELDLVVGMTGGAYGEFSQWYRWELDLVPQFIISAAK